MAGGSVIYGRRVCFKAGDWILCTMIGHRIPERETFRMLPLISFRILIFYAGEKVPHATVIPRLWHSGIYFPPFAKANGPPFSPERETFRMLPLISFRILIFYTEEVAPHVIVIPILQHTAFYFPPAANKDRAVNSMEIKDFIILWTYSQWRQAIVVIPPFSPERETFRMLSFS